jgi:hypothetical protein
MPDLLSESEFENSQSARRNPVDPNAGIATDQQPDGTEPAASAQQKILPAERQSPLFPTEQCQSLGDEWQAIQAGFVDAPRQSVQRADALVKKTVDILQTRFSAMHNCLEQNWEKDNDVSTEDLRLALQNYRSFFQRLLSL